jgi:hypothetical protein
MPKKMFPKSLHTHEGNAQKKSQLEDLGFDVK